MNVELHADQDIIDALQAMKEKADQYSALLSVLRQCVELLDMFYLGGTPPAPDVRIALAAARPYLERKEGEKT